MTFLALLNKKIAPGMLLNALGHLTLGMGHRLRGTPPISVFFGDDEQLKKFWQISQTAKKESRAPVVASAFPHTMSGGDTDKQLEVGLATPESDMNYFAATFMSPDVPQDLFTLLAGCEVTADYEPYLPNSADETASVLAVKEDVNDGKKDKKIVMCANHKAPFGEVANAAVLACLGVGSSANLPELGLLQVENKSGGIYPNISFHPFPVLLPSKNKGKQLAEMANKAEGLVSGTINGAEGKQPVVTVAFGEKNAVEDVFTRRLTRMYNAGLPEGSFVPTPRELIKRLASLGASAVGAQSIFQPCSPEETLESNLDKLEDLIGEKPLPDVKGGIRDFFSELESSKIPTDKKEEMKREFAGRLCIHASGKGMPDTVEFMLTNFRGSISPADVQESFQYAEINKKTKVLALLEPLLASSATTAAPTSLT